MKVKIVLLALLVFGFNSVVVAKKVKPLTPEKITGGEVVNDGWVKANRKKAFVADVRKKAEYVEGHLPKAVSIPYKEKSKKEVNFDASKDKINLKKFPSDKNHLIITYCNGPHCWKSYKAAVELIKAGYTNVHWYRNGGFPTWKKKGLPVER